MDYSKTIDTYQLPDSATNNIIANEQKVERSIFDLFAGCGGLSQGFEQAGFTSIFVNELNDDARATYLANRKQPIAGQSLLEHKELISSDVHELDNKRLDKIKNYIEELDIGVHFNKHSTLDVLAGGPPCQGYSGIGHRRSYSVDKAALPSNRLYEKMATIIENTKPRIFLFENVKGLLSAKWTADGQKGEIWDDVYGRFKKLGKRHGYAVRWQLVYARNYGVPQNRPRVLIIGIRNDVVSKLNSVIDLKRDKDDAILTGFLPAYGETAPDLIDVLGDLIDKSIPQKLIDRDFHAGLCTKKYKKPASGKWQKYFRPGELASKGATLHEQEYSRHSKKVVEKFQAMHANDGVIPLEFKTKKFAQRLLPSRWGNSGPCITACSLADDYVHYSQPRTLTVREWARLQTFPDSYIFRGKRTTGGIRRAGNPREGNFDREVPKYTQIGNAVPVKLAEAIGKHFDYLLTKAGY